MNEIPRPISVSKRNKQLSRNQREGIYLGKMWSKHERAGKLYLCKPNQRVISCLNSPNNRNTRKKMQRFLKELDK